MFMGCLSRLCFDWSARRVLFAGLRDGDVTVVDMYHSALKKEEEKSENITTKLEVTNNLLKSTQRSLQDSKLQICQFQKDLKVSHLSCCMEGNVLGIMEGSHVEDNHEGGADLHVFVKSPDEDYFNQAPVGVKNGIDDFLAMGNMAKDIPSESARKYDHLFMYWVDKNIIGIEDKRCTRIACTDEGFSNTYS